jgi:multidrug efflux pump subunit AcrB
LVRFRGPDGETFRAGARHCVSHQRGVRCEGITLTDVLIKAGAVRFKPILLTALAAMIGAAVILTDPIFQGLAISLLFGLASSTLLTVLVIPAIYRVLRT